MNDSNVIYAQEDPEYQQYIVEAITVIAALKNGDTSGLAALPETFREALSIRMSQRLCELEDGDLNQFEFDVEEKKMISVACIGLREAAETY